MQAVKVKRCREKDRDSRRKVNRSYMVLINSAPLEVCKTFFKIHSVSDKRVRNVLAKGASSGTGTLQSDQRG